MLRTHRALSRVARIAVGLVGPQPCYCVLSLATLPRCFSSASPADEAFDAEDVSPPRGEHFRLRPVRRWQDFAPYILDIKFHLDPAMPGTRGIKELWQQTLGSKIRKAYPKYTVSLKEVIDWSEPTVTVTYVSGLVHTFGARHKTFSDLCDEMADTVHDLQVKEDLLELEKS